MRQDAFRQLQAENPLPELLPGPPLDAIREALDQALAPSRPARARPRRASRRALAMSVAATLLIAAAGLGITQLLPGGSPTNALGAAAAVASAQPTTVAPPGQYYYLHERMFGFGTMTVDEQWWLAGDGSGRVVVTNAGADNPIQGTSDKRFGPGQFGSLYGKVPGARVAPAPDPASVPGDPTAVRQYLESQWQRWVGADPAHRGVAAGTPEGDYLLPNIAVLLEDPQLPPQARSALFTVAGELPGISVQQNVTDAAGRIGEVVSVPVVSTVKLDAAQQKQLKHLRASLPRASSTPVRFQLFFDPSTSQILAYQIAAAGSSPRGVTFSGGAIVASDTATPGHTG